MKVRKTYIETWKRLFRWGAENLWSEQLLILFNKSSFHLKRNFHFDVFSRRVSFTCECRKAIFWWYRRLKSQKISLAMNHGHAQRYWLQQISLFMCCQKISPYFNPWVCFWYKYAEHLCRRNNDNSVRVEKIKLWIQLKFTTKNEQMIWIGFKKL